MGLESVSASEVVIGNEANIFTLRCQMLHAVTVTVCRRPDSNRRWLTSALKATDLDHSATTFRQWSISGVLDRGVARVQEMWVTKMTDNGGCDWVTHLILKILGVSG